MAVSMILVLLLVYSGVAESKLKVVDLTYNLNPEVLLWPTYEPFKLTVTFRGPFNDIPFVFANDMKLAEHTGTHIDAPSHFSSRDGIWYTSDIPADKLVGPLALIDLTEQASRDSDYLASKDDILTYEKQYGQIPEGAIVLLNFGWAKNWGSYEKYFGTETQNDTSTFHFPGLGLDGAKLLSERSISGVGSDCPSIDVGQSLHFVAHSHILKENIFVLENVADMSELPAGGEGVTMIVGALKMDKGSGSPIRLLATYDDTVSSSYRVTASHWLFALVISCLFLQRV